MGAMRAPQTGQTFHFEAPTPLGKVSQLSYLAGVCIALQLVMFALVCIGTWGMQANIGF